MATAAPATAKAGALMSLAAALEEVEAAAPVEVPEAEPLVEVAVPALTRVTPPTPVLLEHWPASRSLAVEEKVISAHYREIQCQYSIMIAHSILLHRLRGKTHVVQSTT